VRHKQNNKTRRNKPMETMTISGEEWVKKSTIPQGAAREMSVNLDGLKYCVVRTYSAGVFAGYVKERNGKEAILLKARRLWFWQGAASLSELAMHGVTKPNECKFPCSVEEVQVTEVIEVIPATVKARESIEGVPEWKMRK
jgi:hypothetical protein